MGEIEWAWLQHGFIYNCQSLDSAHRELHVYVSCGITIPSRKRAHGQCTYIGPRLGEGLIFKVSVSQLDTKEHPGK